MPRVKRPAIRSWVADPLDRSRRLVEILAQTVSATVACARMIRQKPRPVEAIRSVHTSWSSKMLSLLNVSIEVSGTRSAKPTLFVSNHVSYLDIVVLKYLLDPTNFTCFVSKREVASWPIFGAATAAGETIYVDRRLAGTAVDVRRQVADQMKDRFARGTSVVIFPEGTSSLEPLPFKAGPFQTALEQDLDVQPVTLAYKPLRACAYVGDDTLVPHLWQLLGQPQPEVRVHFHPVRKIREVATDRKAIEHEVAEKFREFTKK